MRLFKFWASWGIVSRMMLAVGIAFVAGGSIQTFLFIADGASEHSSRLKRELTETLSFIAPLIADQALVGEYAAIGQLVKKQVTKGELDFFEWADKDGRKITAQDKPDVLAAPAWFSRMASIEISEESIEVKAGGVGYGTLHARMTPVKALNRLWQQLVKQFQIVAVTLLLMLQFIWLIFRCAAWPKVPTVLAGVTARCALRHRARPRFAWLLRPSTTWPTTPKACWHH